MGLKIKRTNTQITSTFGGLEATDTFFAMDDYTINGVNAAIFLRTDMEDHCVNIESGATHCFDFLKQVLKINLVTQMKLEV